MTSLFRNSPLNFTLESEIIKAQSILKAISAKNLKQKKSDFMQYLLQHAAGIIFMTTLKTAVFISGTGGTGALVARKSDGSWSAPVAVGGFTLSTGFEFGVALVDSMIFIMEREGLESFIGDFGSELSLAVGADAVVGNKGGELETDLTIHGLEPVYTYTDSFGLHAGISIGASILAVRSDVNHSFYGRPVNAIEVLTGDVERPSEFSEFYGALSAVTGIG